MKVSSLGLNQLQAAKYEYVSRHVCDWRANPRPFSTIALMQKGSGRFAAAGEEIKVDCGQAFFIPAGSKYISYWQGEKDIVYFAIHFHFDNWSSEFAPQRFCLQRIAGLNREMFLRGFENVRKFASKSSFEQLKAWSAFYNLYSDVLPLLKGADFQLDALKSVKAAVDYIESNSEKEMAVRDLAQMCHLSESRFYALFKRALGCSPIAYRNSVRIRKAMTLLAGNSTIDEIAFMVGFSSAVHFRKVFKDIMGKLPSEFRKNIQF
ncbi:MAG: AraC family transcriptional regulator [Firmicutes bacterium]|jgi:AraC-like DNA-binding protein|nr:AraC family transcriptional regulator [Bacillota bacterium]HQD38989.1 AraC family transcriptional regulator [Bacillota bacterium]